MTMRRLRYKASKDAAPRVYLGLVRCYHDLLSQTDPLPGAPVSEHSLSDMSDHLHYRGSVETGHQHAGITDRLEVWPRLRVDPTPGF